jgi:hypothetical protein
LASACPTRRDRAVPSDGIRYSIEGLAYGVGREHLQPDKAANAASTQGALDGLTPDSLRASTKKSPINAMIRVAQATVAASGDVLSTGI